MPKETPKLPVAFSPKSGLSHPGQGGTTGQQSPSTHARPRGRRPRGRLCPLSSGRGRSATNEWKQDGGAGQEASNTMGQHPPGYFVVADDKTHVVGHCQPKSIRQWPRRCPKPTQFVCGISPEPSILKHCFRSGVSGVAGLGSLRLPKREEWKLVACGSAAPDRGVPVQTFI